MASGFGAGVGVDTRDLRAFIAATRRASKAAARGIHTSMVAAGEIVAVEARSLADEHSTSIGPTIKARARGATVSVQAGGPPTGAAGKALAKQMQAAGYGTSSSNAKARALAKQAANALPGLYEFGNRGGGRAAESGTFRRRVWGHDTWVDQPRWAFLRPAAKNKALEVESAVLKVADEMVSILRTR